MYSFFFILHKNLVDLKNLSDFMSIYNTNLRSIRRKTCASITDTIYAANSAVTIVHYLNRCFTFAYRYHY